jgi:hypothetical protein
LYANPSFVLLPSELTMLSYIQSLGGDIGEGALVAGDDADKELHRCKQIMPGAWIKKVKARFLLRKQALEMDFPDDTEIPDDMCPVCFDGEFRVQGEARISGLMLPIVNQSHDGRERPGARMWT